MSYHQQQDGTIKQQPGNVDVETDVWECLGDFADDYDVQGIIGRYAREGIIAYSADLGVWYWTNKYVRAEDLESIIAEYDSSNF